MWLYCLRFVWSSKIVSDYRVEFVCCLELLLLLGLCWVVVVVSGVNMLVGGLGFKVLMGFYCFFLVGKMFGLFV